MTELKVDATLENLERVLSFVEERLDMQLFDENNHADPDCGGRNLCQHCLVCL